MAGEKVYYRQAEAGMLGEFRADMTRLNWKCGERGTGERGPGQQPGGPKAQRTWVTKRLDYIGKISALGWSLG